MAGLTVSNLTNYTKKATEILRKAVLFTDEIQEHTVQTGVNYKQWLNYITAAPQKVAGTCSLPASGTTTFTEKEVQVATYAYRDSFCENDLNPKALPLAAGTLNGKFDPSVAEAMTLAQMDEIKSDIWNDLWVGQAVASGGSDFIDGWYYTISGDTTRNASATYSGASSSAVTVANIDEITADLIATIPDDMWERAPLTYYLSIPNFQKYKTNRLTANFARDANDPGLKDNFEMWIFGYEGSIKIKATKPLGSALVSNNPMILTWPKNLVVATDEVTELSQARWVYDEITQLVWFQASFKLGAQHKFGSEVVTNF